MKDMRLLFGFSLLCVVLFVSSCSQDQQDDRNNTESLTVSEYDSEIVVEWYSLIKTLTRETEGYTPPVAARAFGYTGVALYEALVEGMPGKRSLSGQLNELSLNIDIDKDKTYHWPSVANVVLAEMTKYFYENTSSERMDAIMALEQAYISDYSAYVDDDVYSRSVNLGNKVVDAILEWASSDGANEAQFNNFPSDYSPPTGPQYWEPTRPDYTPALQPYWGSNRPFITANVEGTQPAAPPAFSTDENSLFFQRAMEVYDAVNSLTEEQKTIAEFWADDPVTTATPPGHSISILNQLLEENNSNLAVAAEGYAKLGIAISDAFISCWKTKYETILLRPVTYINNYIDASWLPVLGTPPFPEYTSGHSVQSGAMAEILTTMFGANYAFTDHTHADRTDIDGSPRSFNSFYEMAAEAAISRLYGGIHYDEAIYLGLEQGYAIGKNVNDLKMD